ncbi:hypothetical protein [Roseateles sp.]|uniref:hypothetical protein n=1 Tax=Roseateles sp. TaxID=1971397 RepID=UPI003D101E19
MIAEIIDELTFADSQSAKPRQLGGMRFKRYKLYFVCLDKLVRRRKFGDTGTSAAEFAALP